MTAPVIQEWTGYVVSVEGDGFLSRLVDVTAGDTVESKEAEIPFLRVPVAERHLVREGAYLTWVIRGDAAGLTSAIDFASTPCWTAEELAAARRRGSDLAAALAKLME